MRHFLSALIVLTPIATFAADLCRVEGKQIVYPNGETVTLDFREHVNRDVQRWYENLLWQAGDPKARTADWKSHIKRATRVYISIVKVIGDPFKDVAEVSRKIESRQYKWVGHERPSDFQYDWHALRESMLKHWRLLEEAGLSPVEAKEAIIFTYGHVEFASMMNKTLHKAYNLDSNNKLLVDHADNYFEGKKFIASAFKPMSQADGQGLHDFFEKNCGPTTKGNFAVFLATMREKYPALNEQLDRLQEYCDKNASVIGARDALTAKNILAHAGEGNGYFRIGYAHEQNLLRELQEQCKGFGEPTSEAPTVNSVTVFR